MSRSCDICGMLWFFYYVQCITFESTNIHGAKQKPTAKQLSLKDCCF